ncbi:TPA: VCBS repeat-containing protein [Morganella morganii]|nr:VCBS repeat-containing protein [Morganella morganii]
MSIVIGVVDKISRVAKFATTTKKGNTLFLHAQEGMDYIVVDKQTGFAPAKIIAVRDGNNLKLFVEGETDPSIVIEDYYVYPAQVIGQTADGTVHNYVPLSSSEQEQVASLNDHQSAPQILDSAQQAPITWDTNDTDWGLITLIAYGLTVAGAMALMINHGGGGKKEEPKVEAPVTNKVVIDDIQDSEAPQIGSVKRGESTNDETPTLHGHLTLNLAADEAVIIYRNNVKIGTAKVAGDGKTWVFEDTHGGLISDNTYTYTARVEHTTGVNKGEPSDGYDIIFDNTAPTQSIIITGVADDVAPVIDNVPDNGYTNDTTPLISGILSHPTEKDEYVVVLRNGAEIGKAVVNGTGWTFADSGLNDGETYVYTAVVRDAAGNTGAVSKGYTIHIDTTAPDHTVTLDGIYDDVAPGTGIVGNNGVTNDTTPELRGQIDKVLADNEILVVYRDGVRIGEAEVSGSAWRYTDSGLANDSHYTYSARVEDAAGNTGLYSNEYGINIKFTGPSQLVTITSVWDDVEPVIAKVDHKGWTNDASPDVNGTLSAALNAGEILSVYRDGNKVGNATVNGTSWTYHEESVLADGQHIYTAYVEDAAHNLGAASNNYEINVDTIAPAQTVTLTEITDNKDPVTGKIPQGGETNDDTPTLHGTLSAALNAGEVVAVYRNGVKVGTAVTSGTSWSYEDAGLASGSQYTYYAKVEDLAGNVSQPSNDYSIALNTDGASQSTHILNITDDVAPVTGTVLAGGYTNDSTPTLNGYITSALTGSEEVLIFRDGAKVGTATVNGTTWTYTDSLENNDGHYIYTAVVRDGAGNQGAMSNDYDIYLDTTPPSQTVTIAYVIDDEGVVQKNILSGEVTDDKTPTVVGTLDAELDATERVVVYRDGKPVGTATVHGTEWAFTDNLANDATYIYTAKVIDKAGNEGHLSDEFSIIVDTGFPSQTVIITDIQDDKLPLVETVKNGGYTNDDTPTLNGTLSENLASGEKVVIFRGDTEVGFAVTTGNNWTFTDSGLTDGNTYVYTAIVRNAAGNTGHESDSYTIHMDTSAPTQSVKITGVWDDVAPELGNVDHNGWTNDTAPQVRGTLSAAPGDTEFVVVLRDGVEVGHAAVTGTAWTFDDSGLADGGTYTYTALVRDLAGNSGAVSGGYTIHVDTTAPDTVVTITAVYDDQAPGIGNVKPGETTNDTTPELRGELSKALADNEVLTVYRDGTAVGKAVVTGTAWTYADSGLANDSHYVYTARVEDKAGNTGAYAADYDIYVKFEGPSQTVQITGVNDDVLPVTGNVLSGGWTNDARPDVSGTLSAALGAGEVLIVMRDGVAVGRAVVTGTAWTYSESTDLTDGQHIYTAHVEDAAQNPGATSNRYEINVDTVPPSQAVVLTHIVDNKDPVTGDVEDGAYTNDDTPTLHGTLSAALGAGEILTVWRNGELLTVADVKVDGLTWSYEDSGLASGSDYTYYVQVQDLAGNTGDKSNSHTIKLNTDGASQGTQILSITDDQLPWTGTVKNGESTNDRTPTLTGSVTAALTGTEKVIILRNGSEVGTAVVNGTAWTYTDAEITTDGRYTYTALVRDEAGNEGAKSNDYVMYLDTTAPSQKAVIDGITDDQAPGLYEVANGGSTNDKTPTLHGTLDGELGAGESLRVFRDGKDVGGAVVTGRTWVFTDTLANDGTYEYKVAVVDAAHNKGDDSAAYGMTLDTTAPSQTVIITDIQDDKLPQIETVKNGGYTNDDTPTLNGTLSAKLGAGEEVAVYRDGVFVSTATVKADGLGWTFTDSGLTDGNTYVYTALVRDAAFNTGKASDSYTIHMDTSAPTQSVKITGVWDDVAPELGNVDHNGWTNDTAPQVRGTLSAAPGDTEFVVVLRDGVEVGRATVTGTGWTFDDSGLADGGTYTYTALVRDLAGNSGAVSGGYTIHVDTTAPDTVVTITAVYDDQAPGIGNVKPGETTNDTTPELRGELSKALADNEVLTVYRDGTAVGKAVVTGTAWTYADSGLANDSHYVYTARVEDKAGNTGAYADEYDIYVKFEGPSQTVQITGVNDDVLPVTGNVKSGGWTNDARPDVSGTLSAALGAGEVLIVMRDGVAVGRAVVTGTAWTYSESTDLTDGQHIYTAHVEDAAQNPGATSNRYEINVDTVAPSQAVVLTHIVDNKDPVTGDVEDGAYTNDDTPTLHGTLSAALGAGEILTVWRNGELLKGADVKVDGLTWSYEDSGLASGSDYTYYVQVQDLAGNTGDKSNSHTIKLNTDGASQGTQILSITDDQLPWTGTVKNGESTNDRTPTLTGSVTAALTGTEKVIILRNGSEVGKAVVNGTAWTYTDAEITTDGRYTYTALVRDDAGNEGAKSNDYVMYLDTTAPSQKAVIDGITDDQAPGLYEVANGGSTNDKTPTLHGTLDGELGAGETLRVFRDGKDVGGAVVTGRTWVFTDTLANDGTYEYKVAVVDAAHNKGDDSAAYGMTLDTTVPSQTVIITDIQDDKLPQIETVKNGGYTNDDTPTLNGTLSAKLGAGEEVAVYRDGVFVSTAAVKADGLGWTFTDSGLTDGNTYVYTALVRDAAFNTGKASDSYTIHMDTSAPTQSVKITEVWDDVTPGLGDIGQNGWTNDTAPQVRGTLSAAPGGTEFVVVLRDGVEVGRATVTGTGWTFDDSGLADGGTYTYTALVRDLAGNSGAVSGGYTIHVDTTAPDTVVTITAVYDDQAPGIGNVKPGETTNDTTPELRGELSKALADNEVLTVYRDGTAVGKAVVTGTAWTYADSGLANDSHYVYTARVEDKAGNTGAYAADYDIYVKFEGPSQTVQITGVNDDVLPVTGNVKSGGWTNDARPDVSGTLSAALGAGEVLIVMRDGVAVGRAVVNGTAWTYSESADLTDGQHIYTAHVEDAAQNPGATSNRYEINVDTVPPSQAVVLTHIVDNKDPVTGDVEDGAYTNDDTPTLHGTLSAALGAGEILTVWRNGELLTGADVKVDGLTWSYEDSGLASGSDYTYYVQVQDLAGNTGTQSNSHTIKLNTDGASQGTQILSITDDQLPWTGTVKNGESTNDRTPTLNGSVTAALTGTEKVIILRNGSEVGKAVVNGTAWTYTDAEITTDGKYTYTALVRDEAGNEGAKSNDYVMYLDTTAPSQKAVIDGITDDQAPGLYEVANGGSTNDKTPTLHGTLDGELGAGETLRVFRDGKDVGGAVVTGRTWVFTDTLANDGTYEYKVAVVDAAHNTGAESNVYGMTLDTAVPTQTVTITEIIDDKAPWTGTVKDGGVTNDDTPTLNGTLNAKLAAGETVVIYRDGSYLDTATVNADGLSWTYTDKGLQDGTTYVYTAYVRDGAYNLGPVSKDYTISLDTSAPTQTVTITEIIDDKAPWTGTVKDGGVTNDDTPTLNGTLNAKLGAGETVVIYRDGSYLETATVNADGLSWTYTDKGLQDGTTYVYTAYVRDGAYNLGPVSKDYTISLDTTAPTQTVTITEIIDDKAPWTGTVKDGGVTNDDTPTLNGTLNAKLGAGETVVIYRDGSYLETATVNADGLSWTYTDKGLQDGTTYVYTAYVRDAAFNLGPVSKDYTISLDTTVPVQTVTITEIMDDKDPQTGKVENGKYTNDDTPTLNGTINAALSKGETVVIFRNGAYAGTATMKADSLSWTYTDNGLTDGNTYEYKAYVRDAAFNEGPESAPYTIHMDSTAPVQTVAITEIMDDKLPGTGKVENGKYTNDDTPTINGTISQALSETEMVAVFRDGVFLDYAKVTGGTNWTLTDTLANDGRYSYTAKVVDKAGNIGPESTEYVINLDTSVPAQTVKITSVLDDVKPFEGNIDKGGYTNDKTPELHGTVSSALKANQVLAIYLNDKWVANVTVNDDLTWQYTGTLSTDGHYTWKAVVETLAGVPGASDEYDINLDTSVPATLATIDKFWDHVGAEQGEFKNGDVTDDRNPELRGSLTQELKVRESVLIFDTTKGAIGSGLEVLMGTAIANGREWAFLVPGDHRLENGSSPKFEALVTNGSTYGKPSADFTLKVDLDINVNVVKTLDTHPIISGSVGFQIYNDEHVKVTVNGKTYSSLDGGVVVDPLNNTWYVKLPANSGLTQGQTYDVVATLYNNDGRVVVKDKTLNEIQVSREPEAPLIPASDDAANKATGMTIGENGAWRIFSNMNVLDQNGDNITNTSSFKTNTLKSNGQQGVYGAMSFIDFDRDGYMDIVGLDSKFADGQQTFKYMPGKNNISSPDNNAVNNEYYAFTMGDSEKRGDGVDPKYSGTGSTSANTYSWWGGIALYDKTGDGYTDILFGDRTPNDAQVGGGYNTQLVWNNKGFFQKDVAYVYTTQNGADKDPNFIKYGQTKQATPEKVVSSVDLNNDGNVDLIHGGSSGSNHINSTDASSGTSGRLVVMSNKGDGGFEVSQILDGINSPEFKKSATILGELNGYGFDGQSVVWADFNGDGWLDMFVGSVNASDGAKDLESIILYNDGKGHLAQNTAIGQIGQANNIHVTDKGNVGGALSVDWNMDGKADVVTIPRLDGDGSPLGKGNQDVTLQLNNSLGPVAKFDSQVLYTSVKNGKGTGYSGLLNIDVDWDGRQDLMVFTGTNGAKLISNTNELKEGTAMHIKILDHEGINAFFGNTVKLYDSNGNLVATQVINHQAGNQTSNSTAMLSFYGLKADETYNAVLLRNVNGVQQNVGAEGRVGDFDIANVNASWGGLTTGKNWDSYVLTAESGTSTSNANIGNGVVGTGYNDTFFATLGENAYEGGGGSYLVNGARQWSDKGGIDIVDFKLAGKTNVTVDLRLTDYQETGYGKQKFSNIEGVRGGDGDDTFYSNSADNFFDGGAGNNTFHLGAGGQDTIMYRLLADDNSGGHGVDQINNFWAGTVEATANADIINIKELLVGYNGKAYDDVAKYVNGKAEISDNTITNYLKLENGSLYLDRDGLGGRYQSEKLADIDFGNDPNGDKVDLAMLLANHQIVF